MMSVPKNNGPIVDPALCRCCRAIKKCRILTAEYTWMGKKEIYADMVMDCYGILLSHVDGNERDSGVCATCVVRLREAVAFRQQVLQCEELFLQAKLEHHDEEKDVSKLKKFDLELKTEPKDYSSDHNSLDDRDDGPGYSDDDAEDNKPLKKEETKPSPPPLPEDLKSEDSLDFPGDSSSDSDEPIKKKAKRKANGAKKKPKAAKKQKAETGNTETTSSETLEKHIEIHVPPRETEVPLRETEVPSIITGRDITEPELHMVIKVEPCSETSDAITETIVETAAPVKKRIWVRPLTCERTQYQILCENLASNEELYFRHYNMSRESFEELFNILEASISKEFTNYRKPILARQRLSVCLRYLITGDSCSAIAQYYGIGRTTVANIVTDVSKAIWDVLQPIYMPIPTTETWSRCEEAFQEIWKIPNCIGSIGGRHIIARSKVKNLPSQYSQTRLKRFSSAVFLAVADPFYNLILIDIGNYGTQDDRGILEYTSFYKDFLNDRPLLPAKHLPNTEKDFPHFFIGNESLPLTTHMLREYPKSTAVKEPCQKRFNDLIRQARTVDSVFDMLTANWRVFRRPVECSVENGIQFAKAVCCLHNFVRQKHGDYLMGGEEIVRKKGRGKAMKGLVPFRPMYGRGTALAMKVRDAFAAYASASMRSDMGSVEGASDVKGPPGTPKREFCNEHDV